jgi:hypothetical protein
MMNQPFVSLNVQMLTASQTASSLLNADCIAELYRTVKTRDNLLVLCIT